MLQSFFSWLLLSALVTTMIRFGVLFTSHYDTGFWGPAILLQVVIFMFIWLKETNKE